LADPEIVIISVVAVAAIVAGVQALRLPTGPAKPKWGFLGGALFGGLFCFVAVWNLIGIHRARHLSAAGVVQDLQTHGGTSSSSYFTVVPSAGEPLHVRTDYAGPQLRNGETVFVEELSFHSTLLRLRVLDGKDMGWSLVEGDGTRSSVVVLLLGAGVILGAWNRRLTNPQG